MATEAAFQGKTVFCRDAKCCEVEYSSEASFVKHYVILLLLLLLLLGLLGLGRWFGSFVEGGSVVNLGLGLGLGLSVEAEERNGEGFWVFGEEEFWGESDEGNRVGSEEELGRHVGCGAAVVVVMVWRIGFARERDKGVKEGLKPLFLFFFSFLESLFFFFFFFCGESLAFDFFFFFFLRRTCI